MSPRFNRRQALGLSAAAAAYVSSPPACAEASPAPLTLTNVASRAGQDLSGAWHYSIDPYRDGMAGFHGAEAGFGHRRYDDFDVASYLRAHPTALIEYDMDAAPRTALPSAWMGHAPELRHYVGLVWYQRRFDAALRPGQRAFIHVGAANYFTRVYVNGAFVGAHEGGFTPFACEVTERIRPGANQITLGVDSEPSADTVPPPVTDWENYGGVTRAVRIVITPDTFIDDAFIRMSDENHIKVSVRLNGARAGGARVRVTIPELRLALSGRADAKGEWSAQAPAPTAMQLWSPDAPKLYDVRVSAGEDTLNERVGFRTIATRCEDILLNGQPIFLRGICLHEEEIGSNPVRDITPERARELLSLAKDGLGCNFVRLAHYPHSEITTRLADEMGLLVWSEIPNYWLINWTNAHTLATARAMVSENIRRDRNRASIMLWSVANETPISEARNVFLRTLIADVRALDDTRLVTAALLTDRAEAEDAPRMVLNDPLADDLDVLGVNTYNGWYSPDALADVPTIQWRSPYGKPMVFSEFGAGAKAGFQDPELKQKFSEEFQADYYRVTLDMCERISFLRGTAPWILKDFRSPRRQHPIYQEGWNRKGVVSETGVRKEAFDVLAARYRAWAQR